ncbi:MAG TPA: DUF2235 domain-containing protein [Rubellimicrobium sp.]|nr:DUF2235 domain-containing protein [Rubellimicrobium sp.]
MKRIAIFCDGTWNRSDIGKATNVLALAQGVRPTTADGTAQVVLYAAGVGAQGGSSWIARQIDTLFGGAMGWGLDRVIEDLYRALVFCYEPGDEIYVFGFSRGAYTARSLVGLIRWSGILPPRNVQFVPDALALYRIYRRDDDEAGTGPARRTGRGPLRRVLAALTGKSGLEAEAPPPRRTARNKLNTDFRRAYAPRTATSPEEFEARRQVRIDAVALKIRYLGVWDTVGSLGLPDRWLVARIANRGFHFHDADLSRMVERARHAVALDEQRPSFAPTLWPNIEGLNRLALDLPDDADLSVVPLDLLPYREEWFPGDHGAVGGGDRRGLSAYARLWVAQGAQAAGLEFEPGRLAQFEAERDPRGPLVGSAAWWRWLAVLGLRLTPRTGPTDQGQVNDAALERRRVDPDYRPAALLEEVWRPVLARPPRAPEGDYASVPSAVIRVAPRR